MVWPASRGSGSVLAWAQCTGLLALGLLACGPKAPATDADVGDDDTTTTDDADGGDDAPIIECRTGEREFNQVVTGRSTTGSYYCALDASGLPSCWWMWSAYGLGGQPTPPPEESFVQVSLGGSYWCGLRVDGTLSCWQFTGAEPAYVHDAAQPIQQFEIQEHVLRAISVTGVAYRWNLYAPDGPPPVWIEQGGPYTQVTEGRGVCFLRPDGTAFCHHPANRCGDGIVPCTPPPGVQCGDGDADADSDADVDADDAEPPQEDCCAGPWCEEGTTELAGTYTQLSANYNLLCGLHTDGSVECLNWSGMPRHPPEGTGPFSEVTAGYTHACALQTDGQVVCWGDNTYSQLDLPDAQYSDVSAGSSMTCAVRAADGRVVCCGRWDLGSGTLSVPGPP